MTSPNYILRFALVLMLVIPIWAIGQQEVGLNLIVDLKHKGKSYNQSKIQINKNGSPFDQVKTTETGRFAYVFDYGAVYTIAFTGEGMTTKSLILDLTSTPDYEKSNLINWEIGILTLYKAYKNVNSDIFNEPVARIFFDEDQMDFAIDYKYGRKREKEITQVEKQLQAEEKQELVVEKQQASEYALLLKEGDKYFKTQNYKQALTEYTKAKFMVNDNEKALAKIDETSKLIERDSKYDRLVLDADAYFRQEEWAQAKDAYQLASSMKPAESYPKTQLSILVEKEKLQEKKNNQFNNHLAVAEAAFKTGNYAAAAESYKKALLINPDAALAQNKLDQSEAKLSEAEKAEAERKNQFLDLLAKAESQIENEQFDLAKSTIASASKMYPTDQQINSVRTQLTEAISAYEARQLVLQKEQAKQKEFESFKKRAQEADQQGNVSSALFLYRRANAIIPNDPFIESRIRALQSGNSLAKETMANASANTAPTKTSDSEFGEMDEMDKSGDKFAALLAEKFPTGVTEKKYTQGNKSITRRFVIKDGKGIEYQMIKHSWGGVYYFKNGQPTTQYIFEKETKQ
jgi:tetratricopeptide (TPR) repeat protein